MSRSLVRIFSWTLPLLSLTACGSPSEPADTRPATVVIQPSSPAVDFIGDELQLSAVAYDRSGARAETTAAPVWSSSEPEVVAVDAQGKATARDLGNARITVEIDGVSGSTIFTVRSVDSPAFMAGAWKISAAQALEDGTERTWEGAVVVGEVSGGEALLEEVVLADGEESLPVRTLLGFGQATGSWYVARIDGTDGTYTVLTGAFAADGGSFDTGDRLDDGEALRLRFEGVREASFRSILEGSDDGGATWSPKWMLTYERVNDAMLAPAARAPACGDDHHFFDFWIGDWDVRTPDGTPAGSNFIESVAGGCAIQENYDGGSVQGTSLTGLDVRTGRWIQIYMDSGNNVLELWGEPDESSLVLMGRRGSTQDRITWTPRDDGTVQQLWETNSGGGWSTYFEGIYASGS
jgi:hypothetical protein